MSPPSSLVPDFDAFADELAKLAFNLPTHVGFGSAGALGGIGALGGAAVGGVARGVQGYRRAREEGQGVGASLGQGALDAAGGAARGAAVGGAAGLVAGGGLGLARPDVAEKVRARLTQASGPTGSAARFGQRQVHAVTGYKPQGGLDELRGEAWTRAQSVDKARKNGVTGDSLQRLQAQADSSKTLQDAGLTSLPGMAKAFKESPNRGELAKALLKHQVQGQDALSLSMLALGPGMDAVGAATTTDPEERAARIGSGIANVAGNIALGPITPFAQMVTGAPLGHAGAAAGRVGHRMFNRPAMAHPADGSGGVAIPAEGPRAGEMS